MTEYAHFDHIPAFLGLIEYVPQNGEPSTMAMLQALVSNEGDGWSSTVEELERYYESCAPLTFPAEGEAARSMDSVDLAEQPPSQVARDHVGIYLDSAATLGRRTAELHIALASPTTDPAFAPEALTAADLQNVLADLREQASATFDVLKENMAQFPDDIVDLAALVLSRRRNILDRLLVVIHTCARKLATTFGPDVVQRPGYRQALIEASIVTNAALAAYSIQEGVGTNDAAGLRAVYGVYLLETREVWAPRPGDTKTVGLAAAPHDLAGFVDLGDAVVQSERIANLLR